MIKKIILFSTSLFIGIGLLVWIFNFIGWEEIKSAFLIFTGWQGVIILLLTALMLFFGMWKWKVILKGQGYSFSHRQLAGPYLSCFSLIYLFPIALFGGEIFRGYILKEKYSVPWSKGITSVMIDKILEITVFLVTIITGLIFFLFKIGLPSSNLGIIIGGVLFFFCAAIGFFYFKSFKRESIARFFIKLFNSQKRFISEEPVGIEREIFDFFKPKNKILWEASILALFRVLVTWLRCWLLVIFLGGQIGILPALSILGFYYFSLLIPIPMALGSHEIVQMFAFGALGIGAGAAPAFTMIQRGAELLLALIGLVIFFRFGIDLLKTLLFRKLENLIRDRNHHP
jgi:uncharacterized protein (TIRG00374 family)